MNLKLKLLAAALPLAFAASSFAAEEPKKEEAPAPDWSWTGHVDVNSAYYLRGITNTYGNNKNYWDAEGRPTASRPWAVGNYAGDAPESRKPAFSWGLDITHSSGFYLGYWGSQLTYSYDAVGKSYDYYKTSMANGALAYAGGTLGPTGAPGVALPPSWTKTDFYVTNTSIENDIYGGYTGKIGDLGYDLGLTYYIYAPGTHSNAPETKIKLTYGDFGASAQTLLEDTIWGNEGDTYLSLTWTKGLPYSMSFTANLGYYVYGKEGKYLGSRDTAVAGSPTCNSAYGQTNGFFFVNGCYDSFDRSGNINRDAKVLSGGFRHLILGISQPIGETGLTWNAQAILSGVNRFNIKQEDKLTVGIAYAF